MLYLLDPFHVFELRILHNNPRTKRFVDRDVNVAVDGRGNYKAGMLPVVRRQVRSAAAEANSQRTARDDHRASLAAEMVGSPAMPDGLKTVQPETMEWPQCNSSRLAAIISKSYAKLLA